MVGVIQLGNETAYDRYPDVFYVASRFFEGCRDKTPHILSFGCSTGEEVFCLAGKYFPNATIVGVDSSLDVLTVARQNNQLGSRLRFALSTPETLTSHGPFDAIFAMSVLCRWPESGKVEDLTDLYTFDEFSSHVGMLDLNLKPGGLMAIYNANFSFMDLPMSDRYDTVLSKHVRSSGFVKRFDRNNRAVTFSTTSDCMFVKRGDAADEALKGVHRLLNEDGTLIGLLRAPIIE